MTAKLEQQCGRVVHLQATRMRDIAHDETGSTPESVVCEADAVAVFARQCEEHIAGLQTARVVLDTGACRPVSAEPQAERHGCRRVQQLRRRQHAAGRCKPAHPNLSRIHMMHIIMYYCTCASGLRGGVRSQFAMSSVPIARNSGAAI